MSSEKGEPDRGGDEVDWDPAVHGADAQALGAQLAGRTPEGTFQ